MSGNSSVEQSGALPFDSTQTIRAVTVRELRDPNQQKWFAVQLVVSDRPVNLETMPRFEVFAAYGLYAIQGRLGANACYALRLGFFSEREAAQTICADLKAFYRAASVVQVSEAEQVRFRRVPSQEVPAQEPSPAKPAASANTTPVKAAAQPSKIAGAARDREKFNSLSKELLEEARRIELAKSARHGTKRQTTSWLSRLLGR